MSGMLRRLGVYGFDHVETVILAALVTEDPLLLIGESGTGKTYLLNSISEALKLEHRHYNASLISFDDLVGFPFPDEEKTVVKFLETPATIWAAQSVLVDEISRCKPEHQNRLFSLIHERRVQGIGLSKLRYRWAAMNPCSTDSAMDYAGSEPLDRALADRFGLVVPAVDWDDLCDEDRASIAKPGGEGRVADDGGRLSTSVAGWRQRFLEILELESGLQAIVYQQDGETQRIWLDPVMRNFHEHYGEEVDPDGPQPEWLRDLEEAANAAKARLKAGPQTYSTGTERRRDHMLLQGVIAYATAATTALNLAGVRMSPRRSRMLSRSLLAAAVIRPEEDLATVFRDVLTCSLPHAAFGVRVDRAKVEAAHQTAKQFLDSDPQRIWLNRFGLERSIAKRAGMLVKGCPNPDVGTMAICNALNHEPPLRSAALAFVLYPAAAAGKLHIGREGVADLGRVAQPILSVDGTISWQERHSESGTKHPRFEAFSQVLKNLRGARRVRAQQFFYWALVNRVEIEDPEILEQEINQAVNSLAGAPR